MKSKKTQTKPKKTIKNQNKTEKKPIKKQNKTERKLQKQKSKENPYETPTTY